MICWLSKWTPKESSRVKTIILEKPVKSGILSVQSRTAKDDSDTRLQFIPRNSNELRETLFFSDTAKNPT
jgi:hypothetical protein